MRRLILIVAVAILGTLPARGDLLRIIENDTDAAQVRADIIQQATDDVSAMYFIVRDDRVTFASLALLREARRRGVPSVRLLADANFTRIPKPLLAHLRDEGVQIRVYHPMKLSRPSWLYKRMHEKLIVADNQRYVTGGRNLAEAYFGLAPRNYVDRDVYVEGISAADAMDHFEAVWRSRHVFDLDVHVTAASKAKAARQLDDVLTELATGTGFLCLDTRRNWSEGATEVGGVRFVHDPVGGRGFRVGNQLYAELQDAKKSILIESPYLVPSNGVHELLERKVRDGVRVAIITNSIHSTDSSFPHAAYVKNRTKLLNAGVELYEFKGPAMLHAKSFIVDDRVVGVGSYNLDPRSQNLNTEVMCVLENEAVAAELKALLDAHMNQSWRAGYPRDDGRAVSRGRRFRAWIAQILVVVPLLENQI